MSGADWNSIDELRAGAGIASGEPQPGAFTVDDYSEHYGVPRETARHHLARLKEMGAIESGLFSVARRGVRRATRYYWPREKKSRRT